MVWSVVRFLEFWGKTVDFLLLGLGGKNIFPMQFVGASLENHAPHPTNSSIMSVTMCLRYILTFVFDGLAFGMWVRSGSYMRKLLRLHYVGNRKYEIKVQALPKPAFHQTRYTWRLDSPTKHFLRIPTR